MSVRKLTTILRGAVRYWRLRAPPVVIGGCERSGTTLLKSVLSAHSRIHVIPWETWAFCHGRKAGFDGRRPIRRLTLFRHLGRGGVREQGRRWCEKSPANIFYFREILSHFRGRVRLVQIVRDGRDVVSSVHPSEPGRSWVSGRRWVEAVTAGLTLRDHDLVHTLRYEDLVLRFEPAMRRLLAFIGEEYTAEVHNWRKHASVDRSRNLRERTVTEVHSRSIRKFDAPDFAFGAEVEELLSEPRAKELLATYGYL